MKLTGRQRVLLQFVKDSHGEQKRKYTHEPYWNHVYAVAEIISTSADRHLNGIEIALCHDLFEDTDVQMPELLRFLLQNGYTNKESIFIISGVDDLTDVYIKDDYPIFNRKERKILEAERLGAINTVSQSVKYADLMDNTKSIVQYDTAFAKVYLNEKSYILKLMRKGDFILLKKCEDQIEKAIKQK